MVYLDSSYKDIADEASPLISTIYNGDHIQDEDHIQRALPGIESAVTQGRESTP
jgi:hypothetical protein